MSQSPPQTAEEIVDLLEKDEGWAYVNKKNFRELLSIAEMRNNPKLVQELKEWP